ncbi:hypothetical protein QUF82_08170 [Thiotrichales bacterium HSG14]|nr:hypothetical protein [Thiotrichales bacterium HSG14]
MSTTLQKECGQKNAIEFNLSVVKEVVMVFLGNGYILAGTMAIIIFW